MDGRRVPRKWSSSRLATGVSRDVSRYALKELHALKSVAVGALTFAVKIGDMRHADYYREWTRTYGLEISRRKNTEPKP